MGVSVFTFGFLKQLAQSGLGSHFETDITAIVDL